MSDSELLRLKAQIDKLSPADRLRLAAGLIDKGKHYLAEIIAGQVIDALQLLRLRARK